MKLLMILTLGLGLACANVYAENNETTTALDSQTTTSVDKNQLAGESFLQQNKKNKGVVALPSGLQYKIVKQGTGPKPTSSDFVTVNYVGTLIDGTEFDRSKTDEPATFKLDQVIEGWQEALVLMPVGSTWMLYVPSKLAYKDQSIPPHISANSALIFKVELLKINK